MDSQMMIIVGIILIIVGIALFYIPIGAEAPIEVVGWILIVIGAILLVVGLLKTFWGRP